MYTHTGAALTALAPTSAVTLTPALMLTHTGTDSGQWIVLGTSKKNVFIEHCLFKHDSAMMYCCIVCLSVCLEGSGRFMRVLDGS